MTHIGIMQGRLVPPTDNRIQCFPRERWADEFTLASQAGLDCIEWIYDLYGADVNPLATQAGLERLNDLSQQHKVKILSICADYFMDKPLLRASQAELDERLNTLFWLLERGRAIGINRMVIPFVDASRIDTPEEFNGVVTLLKRVLQEAGKYGIEIHLETSLNPGQFAQLLARLPDRSGTPHARNLRHMENGWAAFTSRIVSWAQARSGLGPGMQIFRPWPKV